MSRPAFKTSYRLAQEAWQAQERRLRRVTLPRPTPIRDSVARRPAEVVPFTPPAVSILAPKPETSTDIHRFVVEQFREARRLGNKPR